MGYGELEPARAGGSGAKGVAPEGAREVADVPRAKADDAILRGESVNIEERLRDLIRRSGELSDAEALQEMMEKLYEAEKKVIDNLKPSDKEIELRRRRLEEIEELMRELEIREIDFEKALVLFQNMLDPETIAMFEAQLTKAAPIVA